MGARRGFLRTACYYTERVSLTLRKLLLADILTDIIIRNYFYFAIEINIIWYSSSTKRRRLQSITIILQLPYPSHRQLANIHNGEMGPRLREQLQFHVIKSLINLSLVYINGFVADKRRAQTEV
jgi:hypothetical protein